jgi:hypothetical protein
MSWLTEIATHLRENGLTDGLELPAVALQGIDERNPRELHLALLGGFCIGDVDRARSLATRIQRARLGVALSRRWAERVARGSLE